MLRPIFSRRRGLLRKLCHIVERLLIEAYTSAGVEGRPELILFVQTFGDLVTFNPHIHVLAADGVFRTDSVFVVLPAIPVNWLERGFRSEVLKLLGAIGERVGEHARLAPQRLLRAADGDPEYRPGGGHRGVEPLGGWCTAITGWP